MTDASEFEPVIDLANEYLDRYRRGENPSVDEYAERFPDLADQIRDVFPMMLLMEDHAPDETGSIENENSGGSPKLEQLGDFRIIREIGRGGMGIVYEAVQESLGRHVALKVFPSHAHLNPRHQERFKRESRSAAMLHHTNIVPVFAVGDDNGMLYYVMQFIRGAGLDEVISELRNLRLQREATEAQTKTRRQSQAASQVAQSLITERSTTTGDPPSHGDGSITSGVHLPGQSDDASLSETGKEYWESVARIGVQVAEALDYAHGQGTLHRDIKPSNLLLDHDATVWVADFGLAKSLEQDDLTHTGELVGTLRYMPPEQFAGKSDERSDLYSLGLSLYELVTLRPAFDMPDRQRLMRAISESVPPRPRKINPKIPRDLETIVLKTIEREPDRRYQTAGELASDLTRFLNNEPLHAKPVSSAERVAKWARRRPAIAGLAAALASVFLISFGLVTWKWREAETAQAQVKIERDDALESEKAERAAKLREASERKRKEELLEESEQNLYYSLLAQADFQRQQNDINASRRTLDKAPENRRGWEWNYLNGQLNLDLMTLKAGTDDASWIRCLDFSDDGRFLATGSSLPLFVNARHGAAGVARVWDLETGQKIMDLGDLTKSVTGVAFSPDGKQIAISEFDYGNSSRGPLRIWDIASQTELVRLIDDVYGTRMPPNVELQFSPDGSLLAGKRRTASAFQVPDGGLGRSSGDELRVWDAISGRQLWSRKITNVSFEFSKDGSRVLTRLLPRGDTEWGEFDSRTGKLLKEVAQPVGYHVGNHVIDWNPEVFQVLDVTTGDLQFTLRDPHGKIGAFATKPDGSQLATASLDGTIRLWSLATGEPQQVLRGHSTQLLSLLYSSDGRYLASGDWNGNVKVWHLDSARSFVSNKTGRIEDIAFRFGNRALATIQASGLLQTWDVLSGDPLSSFRLDIYIPNRGPVRQAAFDGTGSRIAGGSLENKGVVKVWDVETGNEQLSFPGHEDLIDFVAFSRNGQRVATAAGNFSEQPSSETIGRVKVWDVRLDRGRKNDDAGNPSRELFEISSPGQHATAVAFAPDGNKLAVAGYIVKSVQAGEATDREPLFGIWNIDNASSPRKQVHGLQQNELAGASSLYTPILTKSDAGHSGKILTDINCLAFSPDGNILAAVEYGSGRVHLYDATDGTEIINFVGPGGVQDIAFSPDGKRLAGVTRELTTIWDTENGHEVITLRGKRKDADLVFNPTVLFSPDGNYLASTQWHGEYSFLIWAAEELQDATTVTNTHGTNILPIANRTPQTALNERLDLLNELIRTNPDDQHYRLLRSRVNAQLGDYVKAQADYQHLKENKYQAGLWLMGEQHIRVDHLPFDQDGSFTIETWVKNWSRLIMYQGYGYTGRKGLSESIVYMHSTTGSLKSGLGAEGNYAVTREGNHLFHFEKVNPADWTHYAIAYDDEENEIRSYTNGQLSQRVENVDRLGPYHPEPPFWIGYHPTTLDSSGLMRSFRISRSVRYTEPFTPEPDLESDDADILMFDFTRHDSSTEKQITDLSGSGNHGQYVGAWWIQLEESAEPDESTAEDNSDNAITGTAALWSRRLDNLSAIVEAQPENGWYRLERSKVFSAAGDFTRSRSDYTAAMKLFSKDGKDGLFLEAEQYIESPHIPFDDYESFTVEAWVRNWSNYLIYQADKLQPGFMMDHRSGTFYLRKEGKAGYAFETAKEYGEHAWRFKFEETPADQWIHLAVVRNRDVLQSFVNGRLISSVDNVPRSAPLNREQPFWIGGVPIGHYASSRSGTGTLRSIRVSKTARYVEEFSPGDDLRSDDETILMHDFSNPDELLDSRITDRSSNGNEGTLHNAWWLK